MENRLSERNRVLEGWIPWIQRKAVEKFLKHDNGTCELDDVFQVGCISAMRSMEEDDRTSFYMPFHPLKVVRDMGDHLIKGGKRKESSNLPYDDTVNGSRGVLCKDIDVKSAIAKLDKVDRAIVILIYWRDLSTREIGEMLGVPQRTVVYRHHRAMEKLHEILS